MKPRVFVVMPYGIKPTNAASDKAPFVDYDATFRHLIEPAVIAAGGNPFRADEEEGAGDIRSDMFYELVTADFVLADISILNANVFYELGVRHGVRARGVLMIHGGYSRRPFDIAPDRTFTYDGALFGLAKKTDKWSRRGLSRSLRHAENKLTVALHGAMSADENGIGSPVYKELPGLGPVDWSEISSARGKHFGMVMNDWRSRVRIAGKEGRVGDILTLARDAPDRRSFLEQTCAAGRELVALGRNDAARKLFESVVSEDSSHFDARIELAQVLNRLGDPDRAVEHLKIAVDLNPQMTASAGIRFGRIYKDLWRRVWIDEDGVEAKRREAREHIAIARQAYRAYERAYAQDMQQHWCGLNMVSLHCLMETVGATPPGLSRADLLGAVRTAARRDLHRSDQDGLWAHSTLGECALLEGQRERAIDEYREASTGSDLTWFMVESMVWQLTLYHTLGLHGDLAADLIEILEERRPAQATKREQVVAFAGHMIDRRDRRRPRFPEHRIEEVSGLIEGQLKEWEFGPQSLGICGGAAGCDLLFAKHCLDLGGYVQLLIPRDVGPFLKNSVRLPGVFDWPELFDEVRRHPHTELRIQSEALGEPPPHTHVYLRSNDWRLDSARAEAPDLVRDGVGPKGVKRKPVQLAYLAVWDSTSGADGVGGTASFVASAKELDGRLEIIELPPIAPSKGAASPTVRGKVPRRRRRKR